MSPTSLSSRWRDMAAPLALLTALATAVVAMGLVALAGWSSTAPGHEVPAIGAPLMKALIDATRSGSLDPIIGHTGSRMTFWGTLGVLIAPLLALLGTVVWFVLAREARVGSARASLAGKRDYRDMHGRGAVERARKLRPTLGEGALRNGDLGLRLGRLDSGAALVGGQDIYGSEEDVFLEIAGPRSNKTSAMVVPAILSAPGPVITTSNKVDVWTLTAGLSAKKGKVFTLDPQRIAGAEQTWWWNPLAGIEDMADAQHLVTHFSATVGAGSERSDPYFTKGAERLLCQLVVAAASTGKHSLRDVRNWLAERSEEPVGLLEEAGMPDLARGLQGTIEAPFEQRGGLYETALTALACLESEAVARYVTPPQTWRIPPRQGLPIAEFDPWRFVVGYNRDELGNPIPHDALYLLTREGAGSAAPVVAALVDHLLRTVARAATARGGRVDPPVRAVLDEAANICPIRALPDLYSYFGSMSIQVLTFLQSYQQGVAVWGKPGMDKLWSAATIKLIGAGVHDPEFCEQISRLLGEHDIPTYSHQFGKGGSMSMSTRRDRIMSAADIAALPKTDAVLIAAGRRPARIKLLPWYAERDADEINTYSANATNQVRQAAVALLGPTNPLAQALAAGRKAGSSR